MPNQSKYEKLPQSIVSHLLLSPTQLEIFKELAVGKTVGRIAEERFRSIKTVSTQRGRILEKMGMSNNAEITRYCMRLKLVDDADFHWADKEVMA